MVFAVWAGRKEIDAASAYEKAFWIPAATASTHMDEIVAHEAPLRGSPEELVREYLTRHIVFELGDRDHARPRAVSKDALALDRRDRSRRISA